MKIAVFRRSRKAGLRYRDAACVIGLQICSAVFESFGIAMLVPVFQFMQEDGDVEALIEEQQYWQYLADAFNYIGLPLALPSIVIVSLLAFSVRQLSLYIRQLYYNKLRYRLIFQMRNRSFDAALRTNLDYSDRVKKESIINDLTVELRGAVDCIMAVLGACGALAMSSVYVTALLSLSWTLFLGVALAGALMLAPLARLMKHSRVVGRQIVQDNEAVTGHLVERLSAFRLIRLSGTEQVEAAELTRRGAQQFRSMARAAELQARLLALAEPVALFIGFSFLLVGYLALDMSAEAAGLFFLMLVRLVPIVRDLLKIRQAGVIASASLDRYLERVRDLQANAEASGAPRAPSPLRSALTFKNVSYNYPGSDAPALNLIDLEIPCATMTALVGPSGAGKSTLVDIIPLLRRPSAGAVYFDDTPTDALSLEGLRAQVSYAPQTPQLFDGPVGEHIRYGNPGASEAEVANAARLVGADAFIRTLPDGYATPLGAAGVRLSGGQRQRVDLARALLKPASILVMDEPTSALDAESEQLISDALYRARDELGRTVVIVGHRLALVSGADQIVVMKDGEILERGSHGRLIAGDGWYARAYRTQVQAVERRLSAAEADKA